MKFKHTIKGWNKRHEDQKAVMRELLAAIRNGCKLTSDQQQFWNDTVSLYARYNDGKNIVDIL